MLPAGKNLDKNDEEEVKENRNGLYRNIPQRDNKQKDINILW